MIPLLTVLMSRKSSFFLTNIIILVLFTIIYSLMGMKKHFGVDSTVTNAAYFAGVTHATVGYGDVAPKTKAAKWVVFTHIMLVWSLVAIATSWTFEKSADEFY